MREARQTVQQLAEIRPDGPPVISLYLDAKWSDEQQRERARLFLRQRAARLRESWRGRSHGEEVVRSLDELVRRVMTDIVEQGDPSEVAWDGFAFFSSAGRDLFVGLRTRVHLENELEIEEQPRLLQIARVLADHAPAFVVLVDGRWVRIFEVALGAVLVEAELEQYLPDRVDSGDRGPFAKTFSTRVGPAALARGDGMSQMRYQRHIRDHLEHNLKTAAELLERLSAHEVGSPVVVCGEEELRGLFRRVMSDSLRNRVVAEMRMDSRSPRHKVVGHAVRSLLHNNESRHRQEIEAVIGQALGGNGAVIGTEDTLLALQESRLYTLYFDMSVGPGRGWKCRECDAFGHKAEVGCPYCKGATMTVDLAQEMARRAIASDTRMVVVDGNVRLRHYRGMAGRLRRGISPSKEEIGFSGHEPLPPL